MYRYCRRAFILLLIICTSLTATARDTVMVKQRLVKRVGGGESRFDPGGTVYYKYSASRGSKFNPYYRGNLTRGSSGRFPVIHEYKAMADVIRLPIDARNEYVAYDTMYNVWRFPTGDSIVASGRKLYNGKNLLSFYAYDHRNYTLNIMEMERDTNGHVTRREDKFRYLFMPDTNTISLKRGVYRNGLLVTDTSIDASVTDFSVMNYRYNNRKYLDSVEITSYRQNTLSWHGFARFEYDNRGNALKGPGVDSLAYDSQGRLAYWFEFFPYATGDPNYEHIYYYSGTSKLPELVVNKQGWNGEEHFRYYYNSFGNPDSCHIAQIRYSTSAGNDTMKGITYYTYELYTDTVTCELPTAIMSGPAQLCNMGTGVYWADGLGEYDTAIWQLPTGWSGMAGRDSILAAPNAMGGTDTLKLLVIGLCGDTLVRTMPVQIAVWRNVSVTVWDGSLLRATTGFDSYQWYKDSVAIPGATADSFRATRNGYYYVKAYDGCEAASAMVQLVGVGVRDVTMSSGVVLSPNPSNGRFRISAAEAIHSIELTDISGRRLYRAVLQGNSKVHDLDVPQLQAGVYLIRVTTDGGARTLKVTVEK